MPAGDTPRGLVPITPTSEMWRVEHERRLRSAVRYAVLVGESGGGAYPDHPAPFTPEEVANIVVDECYLNSPDGCEPLEIEGYVSK